MYRDGHAREASIDVYDDRISHAPFAAAPPKLPSAAALIDAIALIFVVLRRLTGLPGGTAFACPMTVTLVSSESNAWMRLARMSREPKPNSHNHGRIEIVEMSR